MATFDDPVADAAEAYKGLRGLAHVTRTSENPADTYWGLDEVSGSVRLLRQVLDQLSRTHAAHRAIAFTDDGVAAEAVALAEADDVFVGQDLYLSSSFVYDPWVEPPDVCDATPDSQTQTAAEKQPPPRTAAATKAMTMARAMAATRTMATRVEAGTDTAAKTRTAATEMAMTTAATT